PARCRKEGPSSGERTGAGHSAFLSCSGPGRAPERGHGSGRQRGSRRPAKGARQLHSADNPRASVNAPGGHSRPAGVCRSANCSREIHCGAARILRFAARSRATRIDGWTDRRGCEASEQSAPTRSRQSCRVFPPCGGVPAARRSRASGEGASRSGGPQSSAGCEVQSRSPGSQGQQERDRKSTRLNSSHVSISYAVFCLKKKKKETKKMKTKKRKRE